MYTCMLLGPERCCAGFMDALYVTVPKQADNITTLTKAAGVEVEPYWPGLFARLFETMSVGDLICNVGAGEYGGTSQLVLNVCSK